MSIPIWAWLLWLAAFVVMEGIALFDKTDGDTLSENVWSWASVKSKGTAWRVRRFALLTLMGWLTAHFLTGGMF